MVFDLDVLKGLSNLVPMAMWNIPRPEHGRKSSSESPGCSILTFPGLYPMALSIFWGSGSRSSSGFADLFLTLGHTVTTAAPPPHQLFVGPRSEDFSHHSDYEYLKSSL